MPDIVDPLELTVEFPTVTFIPALVTALELVVVFPALHVVHHVTPLALTVVFPSLPTIQWTAFGRLHQVIDAAEYDPQTIFRMVFWISTDHGHPVYARLRNLNTDTTMALGFSTELDPHPIITAPFVLSAPGGFEYGVEFGGFPGQGPFHCFEALLIGDNPLVSP